MARGCQGLLLCGVDVSLGPRGLVLPRRPYPTCTNPNCAPWPAAAGRGFFATNAGSYLLSFSRSFAAIRLALRVRNFWRASRTLFQLPNPLAIVGQG